MYKESVPILLVEDSIQDIEIIKRSLKKRGVSNSIHVVKDGEEAINFLRNPPVQPGVIILDIHLPKIDGIGVLREAKLIDPEIVVIMLTGHASLKTAVQSLRREGAFDYLQKSKDDLPELVEAVRLAVEKRALRLQTSFVIQIGGSERTINMAKVQEGFGLSEREIDVVKCLCRGDTNKEIAERLFISELTVKGHLKKIYQKMKVHNRATLVSRVLSSTFLEG